MSLIRWLKDMITKMIGYYRNKSNCLEELTVARRVFGSTKTGRDQYEGMQKALTFMFIYCPEEIRDYVESVLQEANMRRVMFELEWIRGGV